MNLFVDTNVIIGYCIEVDYWHHYAKAMMNNDNIYWSTTVKTESKGKLKELSKTYKLL